jgi:SRSO17 transposase
VQRQDTGTAGHIENAQIAVYLLYATDAGHAMIDRELSVSRGWIKDPERLAIAGVPDQVGFATKPALATAMLARALDARVPAAWVTGDEVYGTDPRLLAELERRGIGYVLAVACDHRLLAAVTPTAPTPCSGGSRRGPGSGCRPAAAPKATATTTGRSSSSTTATLPGGQAGQRWLLVRRNRKTGELAFSHCWTPRPVSPATLVRVAGRRWAVEMVFPQLTKGRVRAVG